MGDTRPCSDAPKKDGDRRVLFCPRKGNPGETFAFKGGTSLEAGLCYDESEIPEGLLLVLIKQGSARWVEPEKPKPLPRKLAKKLSKDSEEGVSSEPKDPEHKDRD